MHSVLEEEPFSFCSSCLSVSELVSRLVSLFASSIRLFYSSLLVSSTRLTSLFVHLLTCLFYSPLYSILYSSLHSSLSACPSASRLTALDSARSLWIENTLSLHHQTVHSVDTVNEFSAAGLTIAHQQTMRLMCHRQPSDVHCTIRAPLVLACAGPSTGAHWPVYCLPGYCLPDYCLRGYCSPDSSAYCSSVYSDEAHRSLCKALCRSLGDV